MGPQLIGIQPNGDALLEDGDVRNTSPTDLTFRFDRGQVIDADTVGGIQITRSGFDGQFGNGNDVSVLPGFAGIGDNPNEVILRFAESLPDDLYRIEIIGAGASSLRNIDGDPFNEGVNQTTSFELDLGAKVLAAVPQPVSRGSDGKLIQAQNEIDIYFTDDDLHVADAENPAFYQLIFANDTVTNQDDLVFLPRSVSYDSSINKATLTFDFKLHQLLNPNTNTFVGPGTYRLRLGTNEAIPKVPDQVALDVSGTTDFNTGGAVQVQFNFNPLVAESFGTAPTVVVSKADLGGGVPPTVNLLENMVFLELNTTPGSETTAQDVIDSIDVAFPSNLVTATIVGGDVSTDVSAPVINYSPLTLVGLGSSFGTATNLGLLGTQSKLLSAAVDAQEFLLDFPGAVEEPGHRDIPDEVGSHFEQHINPDFGPDSETGITTILYNFKSNYGQDSQGNDLVNVISENQKRRAREAVELWGNYIGAQFLETTNQGLTIVTGDPFAIDPTASNVMNHTIGDVEREMGFIVRVDPEFQDGLLILDNAIQWNDSFGGDWFRTAMIGMGAMLGMERATDLPISTLMAFASDFQYPGAPATSEPIFPGNHDIVHGRHLHRPDSNDIDFYRFEVDRTGTLTAETLAERQANSSLLDTVVSLYREEADGSRTLIARNDDYFSEDSYVEVELTAGTYFVGVSANGNEDYNPEYQNAGFGGTSQGPYEMRLNFRPQLESGTTMREDDGQGNPTIAVDGDSDGSPGGVYNFWFRVQDPANVIFVDKITTGARLGTLANPFDKISAAFSVAQPGDIVRIVGNGGFDGDRATLVDNFAYEIGFGSLPGQTLNDGTTMNVPEGVSVMVDSGAIFKLQRARIGVGSSSLGVDRSRGSLQVLGTPLESVYFTSFLDEKIGLDTQVPTTFPRPGDWGGIAFRNDLDNAEERFNYEDEGIFLNYVNQADVRFGGGNVVVDSIQQVVTPIQMVESRPTVSNNTITRSADAAISADPDSFEETNFHSPRFQLPGLFTSDYDRVGPDVHGNLVIQNSTNGLFVRIQTPAGAALKPLSVPGRFDDKDIVHVIAENLQIQGTPGESILELTRPPIELVTATTVFGGSLPAGNFNYKIVFIDSNGFEGRPSEATSSISTVGGPFNGTIQLNNLPPATGSFVARRLYRSSATGTGPYSFVAQIDASDTSFADDGSVTGSELDRDPPSSLSVALQAQPGGTLAAATYDYRIVYVDAAGVEGPASDPTSSIGVSGGQGTVALSNLPTDSGTAAAKRIYRSTAGGGAPYMLAGEILVSDTDFNDDGALTGKELNPTLFGVVRARLDARLTIDPGTVVKLEGARIETTFGAQFLAEGRDGREIIFTSKLDDRYGAGGTFDTNSDGNQETPAPGDWGGLYMGHLGEASIDHALLTYGGGVTKIEGTFVGFGVLEIQQSDARVANSVIEKNANGLGGQGPTDRFGRLANEDATIFVRGAQPVLVDNIIRDNDGKAITIDLNSLTPDLISDPGRQTGLLGITDSFDDNQGPLIRGNRMDNNPLMGLDIRADVLTTQSVWDDTDVVHIITDLIVVPDFHTFGGLRLESSPTASLVVKLGGAADNFDPTVGAGITALGRELDIDDRIGGSIQIIGQPDFPVVMTSLADDAVGAGLTPDDHQLTDTNNDGAATAPAPGDWRSLRLEDFSNDRNVETWMEVESPKSTAPGENATPDTAQFLGELAPFLVGGDDNLRLGFEVHGTLNAPHDVDIYSFDAEAGTEVWLDIDRTTRILDTVVEVIDADGNLVARSDNSLAETLLPSLLVSDPSSISADQVNPLQKKNDAHQPKHSSGIAKDHYSTNVLDAGMRIVLPGVVGTRSPYHVRVRSSSPDLNDLSGGLTDGSYQLQIRLTELDEVPGSTVRYADIRYSTNGLELVGVPYHSPLLGEVGEDEETGGPEHNNTIQFNPNVPGQGAQDIGNLLTADRGTLSIGGAIASLDDIDFYEMQVAYDANSDNLFQHASVAFDVDYANGLSRADTIVSVFDPYGRLLLLGYDSNITDDRPSALGGDGLSDLSRGSLGSLDPFVGPVELPEATYFVAVTSNARIPSQLLTNPALRLEPINTITRVAEDHIGSYGGSTAADPQVNVLLDDASIVPANPEDIRIFILHDTNPAVNALDDASLTTVDPLTGAQLRTIGPYGTFETEEHTAHDLATRVDGSVFTLSIPETNINDANAGLLRGVDTSQPQWVGARDDSIETWEESTQFAGVAIPSDVGINFEAMTFGDLGDGQERLFAVGHRGDALTPPIGPTRFTNLLYQLDSRSGQAISAPQQDRTGNARFLGAGTQVVERGQLDTNAQNGPGGIITGLAIQNSRLYALTDTGGLFLVNDPLTDNATLDYIGELVPDSGYVQDTEPNNAIGLDPNGIEQAQDLDVEIWTQRFDANIGDALANTSTTIKHVSIDGVGDDPFIDFIIRGDTGGLDEPTGATFGPDGNFYVASGGTNEVIRYDGQTGQLIDVFVSSGIGALQGPRDIVFGPDGNLYVANFGQNSILRYDGQTGSFINNFIAPNVGGLAGPTGMEFGPDGHLYVASSATNEVLQFNGQTGRFQRVFVAANLGGLANPQGIRFGSDDFLYVASGNTNAILRYDGRIGVFDRAFVPSGSGELDGPNLGLEFGPDGHLYVSSANSNHVARYHGTSGAFLDNYVPPNADTLTQPSDLNFDANGNLYVNSFGTDRVLVYSDDLSEPSWQWQYEPTAAGGIAAGDLAGTSVAISGDTMVVGAPQDDDAAINAGAVYVYLRDDSGTPADLTDDTWQLQSKLTASDAAAGDEFGVGVALDDDLLAVGAWQEDQTPGSVNDLAATNLTFVGNTALMDQDDFYNGFTLRITSGPLVGEAQTILDYDGATRTITLAAGLTAAPADGTTFEIDVDNAGAVYVFRRVAGAWTEEGKLNTRDPEVDRLLGRELSVSAEAAGDTLIVGAPREVVDEGTIIGNPQANTFQGDTSLSAVNDAYNGLLLRYTSGALEGQVRLVTDYVGNTRTFTLAPTVPVSPIPAVGTTFELLVDAAGAAYVFRFDGTDWFEQVKLVPSDSASIDGFGRGVDFDSGSALVGSPNISTTGAAYVFELDDNSTPQPGDDTWTEVQKILARDGAPNDKFGQSVSILGQRALIGAVLDNEGPQNAGSVYVFHRDLIDWQQSVKLVASDPQTGDLFGESVDLSAVHAIVGSPQADVGVNDSGSVYVFELDDQGNVDPFDDVWTQVAEAGTSNTAPANDFGMSVSIDGSHFVGGDPTHDFQGTDAGTAQVFVLDDLAQGTFETFFVPFGTGALDDPRDLVFGPDGLLYIASATSNRVLRFDPDSGTLIDTFVNSGSGGLSEPQGLAFGPDGTGDGVPELFVTSRGSDQVLRYNGANGAFLDVFSELGLVEPTGLTFGADRTSDGVPELFVAGFGSDNVVEFNGANGTFIRQFVPPVIAGLDGPVDIEFRPDGFLYVASANTDSVRRYDANTGAYEDDFVVPGSGGLDEPQYLAFGPDANNDGEDELYVSSFANDSVLRYSAVTGAFVDSFVIPGNEGLDGPTGINFSPVNGLLYVSGSLNDAIMRFDQSGMPTFDYYKFTIDNDGDRGIFDIDFGDSGAPDGFNAEIFVLNAGGGLVDENDDEDMDFGQGGSVSDLDPFLDITFPTAGVYYVMVGEFDSDFDGTGNRPDLLDTYTLHVSIETPDFVTNLNVSSFAGVATHMRDGGITDPLNNTFVSVDRGGQLYAHSTDDTNVSPEPIFLLGRSQIPTDVEAVTGLAISSGTLWHITDARHPDQGHGLTNVFDDSRGNASFVPELEPNDTLATADELELAYWHLGYNSNIGDASVPPVNTSTFIPHVTVKGDGDGTHDFYSFVVETPNSRGIFDIDIDFDEQLDPVVNGTRDALAGFMDAELSLFDSNGNLLAFSEDTALVTDGDGGNDLVFTPPLEPFIDFTFATPGTYVLQVTKRVPPFILLPPDEGDFYTLQVSLQNHRVDGPASDGGLSFLFGPEMTGDITLATPTLPVQITSPRHGLQSGNRVYVQDVMGIPGATGAYTVARQSDDTFQLLTADGRGGTYQGGGTWRKLNIPEDVKGTLITNPFSLLGYSADDKPVLYFNYYLEGDQDPTIDLATVYVVESDGTETLVAAKDAGMVNAQANTPQIWRQARIELDAFANKDDLRLRFTFDSADDIFSNFEGMLIDDIVIGFAERGEMVSAAYNDPSFTINPDVTVGEVLVGEYQLEIRQATDPGFSQTPVASRGNSLQLVSTFDTNERFAQQVSVIPPAGSDITDGDTFTISDGLTTLVFEFDDVAAPGIVTGNVRVPYRATDTEGEVGASIRTAVNSSSVQTVLSVTATLSAATLRGTNFADGSVPTEPLYQIVNLAGPVARFEGLQHVVYDAVGDSNLLRDQGQVIIQSNFITDSRDFGITVDAGLRNVEDRVPVGFLQANPGSVRKLRELNNSPLGGLAPGAVIENNVIAGEGLGGIHFSGDIAPYELVPARPAAFPLQNVGNATSGDNYCDGQLLTIHSGRITVNFEFEEIGGSTRNQPCPGSGNMGGNGWTAGNHPIFYRKTGGGYLLRTLGYTQTEMAIAIRDAINSSILVTNGTTENVTATVFNSRALGALLFGPDPAVYIENAARVIQTQTDRDCEDPGVFCGFSVERRVAIQNGPQPFGRILNNTVFGGDGDQGFFVGSGLDEPNDTIENAIQTQQGRQHNLQSFNSTATIGDGVDFLDKSRDVDFYEINLDVGDRVTVDTGFANVLVNDPTVDPSSGQFTQSETTMTVFGDTVLIGYNDSGASVGGATKFTGYSLSVDGGQTFTDMGHLPDTLKGDAGDPIVARDDISETIYFATLSNTQTDIQVFRSFDNGQTFTQPVNGTPGAIGFQDKEWMTVDNFPGAERGNIYLAATDFGGGGISFYRSTDDGNTFGPTGGVLIPGVHGSSVVVRPNHDVHVFYFDGAAISMVASRDGGLSFGAPATVAFLSAIGVNGNLGLTRSNTNLDSFRTNSFPQAAVNPKNGNLYVVYNDVPFGTDKADVFLVTSDDGGLTWSIPTRVNADFTLNDQWQPSVAVTPDGSQVGVFWYDRRLDPANGLIDYWGRIGEASPGTVTFPDPDFRITKESFLPVFGVDATVNPTYMGDYDQAQATDDGFYVTWADNLLGTPDISFSKIVPSDLTPVLRLFNDVGEEQSISIGPDPSLNFTAVEAGTYYVGVSGTGNETYDPLSLSNREKATNIGSYDIEINVRAPRTWVITAVDGTQVADGATFEISDTQTTVTYEFDDVRTPGVQQGHVPVVYDGTPIPNAGLRGPGYRPPEMAVAIAAAIGPGLQGVTATALGGFQGRSGPNLPNQTGFIIPDTNPVGTIGFGHNLPGTVPDATGELYVVIQGASNVRGILDLRPNLRENVDQLVEETGILVSEQASPTILNNALANLESGIIADISPTTVVGASIYQYNHSVNSNVGTSGSDFNIALNPYDRFFVNSATGNFYPAAQARTIDSAIDTLEERAGFASIKGAMGIPVSPILAPDLDANGLLRSDDPDVATPSGLGANVFKDRGAIDRADFVGPDAILVDPRDNDANGIDRDPAPNVVQLSPGTYTNFTIQLVDGSAAGENGEGVGVDDSTVRSPKLTITEDGRLLKEGEDYAYLYNEVNNSIRLTPPTGVWPSEKTYVITLNNIDRYVIDIPDGSEVNDGELFLILDENNHAVTFEYESGFSLLVPETLTLRVPAIGVGPGGITDGQRFTTSDGSGNFFTFEYDSNVPPNVLPGNLRIDLVGAVSADEVADATVAALNAASIGVTPVNLGRGRIHVGAPTASFTVNTTLSNLTQSGQAGVVSDGQSFTISDGVNPPQVFEFDSNGFVPPGRVGISFSASNTHEQIAQTMTLAITGAGVGLDTAQDFGNGHIHLGGTVLHSINTAFAPNLTVVGRPGVTPSSTLAVPLIGAGPSGIEDGQTFTITDGSQTASFEFDDDGIGEVGNRLILFTDSSTVDQLADSIVAAIRLSNIGLSPVNLGNGEIRLFDTSKHSTDVANTALTMSGVPGGAVPVDFLPDASFDSEQFATVILNTLESSDLSGYTVLPRGGTTFFIEDLVSISGRLPNFFLSAIKDDAGNELQPNQQTNVTQFIILMPGVVLDFGDAPTSFPTEFAMNGARHVVPQDVSLYLGQGVSPDPNGQPGPNADADDDDGVVFGSVLNRYIRTPITVTASEAGLLDGWIDFNRDGDWLDPGEQIFASLPVAAGVNALDTATPALANIGPSYARFRLSSAGALLTGGISTDGEVEDYLIEIVAGTPPDANDDVYATDEDTPLNIAAPGILGNDTDPDLDVLTVLTADAFSVMGAQVTVAADGSFVYDPTSAAAIQALSGGQNAVDTFTYQATDGLLPSNVATVSITLTGINDVPDAVDDAYATDEDTLLNVSAPGVMSNDSDADVGDSISVTAFDATSLYGATVTMNPDGSFSYDPLTGIVLQQIGPGDSLDDTFTYTISDPQNASDTATVTVTVAGLNDPPIAVDDLYNTDEDTSLAVNAANGLLDNDSDFENDPISVSSFDAASLGGAVVNVAVDGSFTYDPTAAAALQAIPQGGVTNDTFNYTITDGNGFATATATIDVAGINDNPTGVDDNYAVDQDQMLNVAASGVLGNDSDIDIGDVISAVAATGTSTMGAAVTMNADGSFSYDPRSAPALQALVPAATATDTFTYTVADDKGGSTLTTVSVLVTGVNVRPTAADDAYATDEDTLLQIAAPGVLGNDSDPDGQPITLINFSNQSALNAPVVVNNDGSFSYDPSGVSTLQALSVGQVLNDTFTYTIRDTFNATDTGTVTISVTGVNDVPIGVNDGFIVPRNVTTPVDVLTNDGDVDGTLVPSSVTVVGQASNGVAVANANGTVSYTPTADFNGSDSFTYTVEDNDGGVSNVTTVTLNVNDAPVANDDSAVAFKNTPVDIDVLANDTDGDGTLQRGTVTIVTPPVNGSAVVNTSGTVTYTPDAGYEGQDSFTYVVSDDDGSVSNEATVTIVVQTNPFPWQNPRNHLDVNDDGLVSPIDALLVINDLNFNGSRDLPVPPVPPQVPPPFLDTSGNNRVEAIDALLVINFLNNQGQGGEGEGGRSIDAAVSSFPVGVDYQVATRSSTETAADATPSDGIASNDVDYRLTLGEGESVDEAIWGEGSFCELDQSVNDLAMSGNEHQENAADLALGEMLEIKKA